MLSPPPAFVLSQDQTLHGKIIIKPSSPTLRPDHPKEYQVLARTNNLFYAQYVKEHVALRQKKLIKPQRFKQQIILSKGL